MERVLSRLLQLRAVGCKAAPLATRSVAVGMSLGKSAAPQRRVTVPVHEVKRDTDQHPDPEPLPRPGRETEHDVNARPRSQQSDGPDERNPERAWALGLSDPQDQHSDAYDGKR